MENTMADEALDEVVKVEEAPAEVIKITEQEPETDFAASIEHLKRQLEEEKQARVFAERREREAQSREYAARNTQADTELQLVNNAIQTVSTNTNILKSYYAEAMQAGDYNRAAEIQQEMSSNEAKRLQLENGKAAMESAPKQEPPRQHADPVEALASQLTPRSAEWIRRNPQFARDQRLFQKMINAHNNAISDGIAPDSDDYFAEVESILKINRNSTPVEHDEPSNQAAQVTQRRVSPASAPVTRTPAGSDRQTTVRLSADEREMASMMKMTPEEYAKNKLELKRAGKIN